MDDKKCLESTFCEIQYETYELDQYCGDIRRLSEPNLIIFVHEMEEYLHDEEKYECIDYLSTEKILYMSISYDYNDQGWGS